MLVKHAEEAIGHMGRTKMSTRIRGEFHGHAEQGDGDLGGANLDAPREIVDDTCEEVLNASSICPGIGS